MKISQVLEGFAATAIKAKMTAPGFVGFSMTAGAGLEAAIRRNALHTCGKGAARELGGYEPTVAEAEAIGSSIAARLLDLALKSVPLTDATLYELGARSVKEVRNVDR